MASPPKVKLFQSLRGSRNNYVVNVEGCWVSEKYDGVRAIYLGEKGKLVTCRGIKIDVPRDFFEQFPEGYILDGELWINRQNFETIGGLSRKSSIQSSIWKSVKYLVFDVLAMRDQSTSEMLDVTKMPFEQRQSLLQKIIPPYHDKIFSDFSSLSFLNTVSFSAISTPKILDQRTYTDADAEVDEWLCDTSDSSDEGDEKVFKNQYIYWIQQYKVPNQSSFQKFYNEVIKNKGEGVVVVPPGSFYCAGQKNNYKLKEVDETEGVVIGYKEGNGKNTGLVGSFVVLRINSDGQVLDKQKFSVGSGLTQYHREHGRELYPPGTILTCHFNGTTSSGIPRFPRFKGVRPDIIVKKSDYDRFVVWDGWTK